MDCVDHWHCNPYLAAHGCDHVDRAKPCPTCAEKPPTGAHGWPMVPSRAWVGELTLACPKCGSSNFLMTVAYGPGGRLGSPGATDILRCKSCGHTDYKSSTWRP